MFELLNAKYIEQGQVDTCLSGGRQPVALNTTGMEHRQTLQLAVQ